jgi:amino acid permease
MAGIYLKLTVLPLVAGGDWRDDEGVSKEIPAPTEDTSLTAMSGELRRTISIPQGVALYLGAVLGAGVLLLPGLGASQAGPASLISWAFDCILGIPLALTFASLAAHTPDAGGVLTYATRAFGSATGTVIGWFYFVAAATAQALVALTGAYYVAPYLGLSRIGIFAVAGAVLFAATTANVWGLKMSGRLQLFLSGTVAVLLLLTIVVALPRMHAINWTPFDPHGIGAIGKTGVTIFFAFFGWEAICHLSAEFRDPARSSEYHDERGADYFALRRPCGRHRRHPHLRHRPGESDLHREDVGWFDRWSCRGSRFRYCAAYLSGHGERFCGRHLTTRLRAEP